MSRPKKYTEPVIPGAIAAVKSIPKPSLEYVLDSIQATKLLIELKKIETDIAFDKLEELFKTVTKPEYHVKLDCGDTFKIRERKKGEPEQEFELVLWRPDGAFHHEGDRVTWGIKRKIMEQVRDIIIAALEDPKWAYKK